MISKGSLTNLGAIVLITIGWGIAGAIGAVTTGTVVAVIIFPTGWVTGGLVMALILHWAKSSLRWSQVLVLTISWTICWPFSLAIGSFIGGIASAGVTLADPLPVSNHQAFTVGVMVGLTLAGILGGIVTGGILQWAQPLLVKRRLFLIVLGWSIAWGVGGIIGLVISGNIVSPVGWGVAGAIDSMIIRPAKAFF